MSDRWFADLEARLPQHARLIGALRDAVAADERWRWFDVSCSLGAGRGDELSDIDCAIGFADPIDVDELEALGEQLVASVGDAADMLVHVAEGWQPETRRFAVEYIDGLQLDLVLMPAPWMPGLRDGEVALVDKDGALAMAATSYGLTSLLDYEPFELPEGLAATYPVPDDYASVAAAASAVAALLADCTRRAATSLASDLSTPWETSARTRLAAALR